MKVRGTRVLFVLAHLAVITGFFGITITANSEEPVANELGAAALRVFLDCERGCDMTFIRGEIPYINYIRDRLDAQVHVMVTRERSGSGREYTLLFYGLETFSGLDQRLRYYGSDTDTDDERRRGLTRVLKLGLVPYVMQTPAGSALKVSYADTSREVPRLTSLGVQPADDPWNYWVFRSEVRGQVDRQDRRDETDVRGSFYASRTTENWRLGMGTSHSRMERNFEFDSGDTLRDVSRRSSLSGWGIKSLGEHWGVGLGARREQSSYRNLDRVARVAGAVEYNLYPYSQYAERSLTFGYYTGVTRLNYETQTIFGELEESRADQGLFIEYDLEQRWGDIGADIKASHFLDDMDLYRISIKGDIDYRIVRGLDINFWAEASLVRDQIYLAAGGTTDEEVLLGRRALDTEFETKVGLSLKYTFGSIYNNAVNNRLSGSSFTRLF
tara:strand:- start:4374 stop:5699 length:1326 start_codon:yes stop_codon:yes gene_type:complete